MYFDRFIKKEIDLKIFKSFHFGIKKHLRYSKSF